MTRGAAAVGAGAVPLTDIEGSTRRWETDPALMRADVVFNTQE